jgi:predicted DNA-binding transcriptional regulator YafY
MGEYLLFERFVWFHKEVQKKKYPNAAVLADHFGLSERTAHRNIEYMRHYLGAPLLYDSKQKGYTYGEKNYELPYLHATQEEILALLLSRNLLMHASEKNMRHAIKNFSKKILDSTSGIGITEEQLDQSFSATWNGYSPPQGDTFRQTAEALLQHHLLEFRYTSPKSDTSVLRQVEPHHLQHYMGSWILIAWCRLRFDWRKFFLSRMSDITILEKTFHPRPIKEWQHLVDGAFGIFQGHEKQTVLLRFSPERARWIKEQIWHPKQKISENDDGSLDLSIPVADFREIKLRVLQYGCDIEVLEPQELRAEIKKEIRKMADVYKTD